MTRKTIAQSLEEKRVLIFNSNRSEVAPQLASLGADSEFISKGELLYNEVITLGESQKKEQQEESLAYDRLHELKAECKATARKNYKLIKLASRADKNLQDRLKINAAKETTFEEWIKQTLDFINLVLNEPDLLTSIVRFNITTETLNQDKSDLELLKTLRNTALAEKGQAQEATRLRNEKMDELDDYCYELKTIALFALEGQPQLLEMLGITVRS